MKDLSQLTDNEQKLIMVVRSLHPFEEVVISADKEINGIVKVGSMIIKRSYREIWTSE